MKELEKLRKAKNFSHQYMANQLNISKPFYWQIEKGKRKLSYIMAIKIAKIFNKMPDEIFYNDVLNNEKNR